MENLFDVQLYTDEQRNVVKQKLNHASVTWKITDFKTRTRCIVSPEFLASGASWIIVVYPYGTEDFKDIVNVTLLGKSSITTKHIVSAKFTVPCSKGPSKTCEIDKYTVRGRVGACELFEIASREDVLKTNSGYLENGTLTIKCDVTVFGEITEICKGESLPETKDDNTDTLSKSFDTLHLYDAPPAEKDDAAAVLADFESLLLNPRFSDVTLKVRHYKFPAHKLVLRSRSKVFEAMFEHEMKENRQDTVNLVDMEVDTVKDMLSYIYSGKMRQLSPEEALNLYIAADRYDLQKLVHNCRKIMLSELSVDNICEVATVADFHNDRLLMDAMKSFLYENMKDVFTTDKWTIFAKANPVLSLNLIQSAVIKNQK